MDGGRPKHRLCAFWGARTCSANARKYDFNSSSLYAQSTFETAVHGGLFSVSWAVLARAHQEKRTQPSRSIFSRLVTLNFPSLRYTTRKPKHTGGVQQAIAAAMGRSTCQRGRPRAACVRRDPRHRERRALLTTATGASRPSTRASTSACRTRTASRRTTARRARRSRRSCRAWCGRAAWTPRAERS